MKVARGERLVRWDVALVALVLCVGCTPQQKSELRAFEAAAVADAHTVATLTAGAATALENASAANPAAVTELGTLAATLAKKEGLSAADVATLQAEITPQNVQARAAEVKAVALRVQGATGTP